MDENIKMKKNSERIWLEDSNGEMIGRIEFPVNKNGNIEVIHTIVDPSYGGRGLAGKLVKEFAGDMKEQGKKAEISCSYAAAWIEKHPEYSDIVIENHSGEAPSCKIRV